MFKNNLKKQKNQDNKNNLKLLIKQSLNKEKMTNTSNLKSNKKFKNL